MYDDDHEEECRKRWDKIEHDKMLARIEASRTEPFAGAMSDYEKKKRANAAKPVPPPSPKPEPPPEPPSKCEAQIKEEAEAEKWKYAGYFKLPRNLFESELWKAPSSVLAVFLLIMVRTRHSNSRFGKKHEFHTSYRAIRDECSIGHGTAKAAVQTLIDLGIISTHKGGNQQFITTLLKFRSRDVHNNFFAVANYLDRWRDHHEQINNNSLKLLVWLIGRANWSPEPRKSRHNGLIHRGEVLTGWRRMIRETGLCSASAVVAVKTLIATGTITKRIGGRGTIFTLVNYATYQDTGRYDTKFISEHFRATYEKHKKRFPGRTPRGQSGSDAERQVVPEQNAGGSDAER